MSAAIRAIALSLRSLALGTVVALLVLGAPASPAAAASSSAVAGSGTVQDSSLASRVEAVFGTVNDYWAREFVTLKALYQPATLNIYAQSLPNVCDAGGAVVGPFYCPDESRVYLSQAYLQQVASHAGSSADLALAYVVGHEVGEHIQDLIGTTEQVEQARARSGPQLSARTWAVAELQADCYAGLAIREGLAQRRIAAGDASVALQAVASVSAATQSHLQRGDVMPDPLQTYVMPAQRLQWFQRGLSTGNFSACDTFSAEAAGKL
jgi:hypothetical protein